MEELLKSLSQMEGASSHHGSRCIVSTIVVCIKHPRPGGGSSEKGGGGLPQGLEAMLAGASSGAPGANPFGLSDKDLK
eukprot:4330569-Pyramimonas_sp.AAC.1